MLKVKKGGGGGKLKATLLDSSESSGSECDTPVDKHVKNKKKGKGDTAQIKEFSINKDYAEKYEKWRNLEETQKLKDRLGVKDVNELDEESSSESSEEEMEWSSEKEKAFLKTLACLKTKSPKIYEDQFGFFKNVTEDEETGRAEKRPKAKKDGKKPFTVRDHERVMTLQMTDIKEEGDDEEPNRRRQTPMSYPEQLASIKTEFSKALKDIPSSDEEDEDTLLGSTSNLLKKRVVKEEEMEQEDEEYKQWLKGELESVGKGKLSKEDKKDLSSLREFWNDDKLDEGEKFLRDYILNKKYIDPKSGDDDDYIPSYNEIVDGDKLSDDEKFEEQREEFEHKYNFRFEEPDQEFIKRYPRTIQESMRRDESKRKDQRQKAKDRKEEAKARKKEEVQRLKALKRKEIMDKIQTLHQISGNADLDLTEVDIDGDFDPAEYDRRMQELFNDDYYQEGADQGKPIFPYDEEIDDEENWAKWVPPSDKDQVESDQSDDEDEESTDHENDFGNNSKKEKVEKKKSTQQELIESSRRKRGRRKRSAFLDALEREKPKFDPKVHKSFEEYFDEYYKLDFEDLVGDLKCRFKYHKTTANDFGLSINEILSAKDKELNQWASIKKTFQYRNANEEEYEVKAYKNKRRQEDLKKRTLPSVYEKAQSSEPTEENEDDIETNNKKKKKKKKKKKNKNSKMLHSSKNQSDEDDIQLQTEEPVDDTAKPQKSKKRAKNESDDNLTKEVHVEGTSTLKKSKKNKGDVAKSPSPQKPTSESPTTPTPSGLSKRQRKNLKRKSLNVSDGVISDDVPAQSKKKVTDEPSEGSKSSKKGKMLEVQTDKKSLKRKSRNADETNGINVDEDRLRAYGLNPKKFKKRMKYGASVNQ